MILFSLLPARDSEFLDTSALLSSRCGWWLGAQEECLRNRLLLTAWYAQVLHAMLTPNSQSTSQANKKLNIAVQTEPNQVLSGFETMDSIDPQNLPLEELLLGVRDGKAMASSSFWRPSNLPWSCLLGWWEASWTPCQSWKTPVSL